MENKPLVIIVAGHGGMNIFNPDTDVMSEPGWWTRRVGGFVAAELKKIGIDAELLNPGPINVPQKSLAGYINDICRQVEKRVCVIEIGTLDDYEDEKRNGCKILVSERRCPVEWGIAHELYRQIHARDYKTVSRGITESDHPLVKKTICPSVCFLAGHTTNTFDAEYLQRATEQKKITMAITGTIKAVYDC